MNFDAGDFILWGSIIGYWTVAIRRVPTYYRRFYRISKDKWTHMSEVEHQRSGAWHAMGIVWIWPWYEGIRWLRDHIIHRMTIEERKQAQIEEARKIIADYEAEQFRDL